jgi:glycosyltransferase involved in cell wall biosynthesis
MKKKKVLFTMSRMGWGGAEKVLLTLLKSFSREKYEIDLLLYEHEGALLPEIPKDVRVLFTLGNPKKDSRLKMLVHGWFHLAFALLEPSFKSNLQRIVCHLVRSFPQIFSWMIGLRFHYDIGFSFIHFNTMLLPVRAPKMFSKSVLRVASDIRHSTFDNDLMRSALAHYDKIVFNSKSSIAAFVERFPEFPHSKTLCIYNPTPTDEIRNLSESPCDYQKKRPLLVLAMGRLEPQKRFDRLIEAWHRLMLDGFDAELVIMGRDEGEKETLQKLVSSLEENDTVSFLDFRRNPYPMMALVDVVVLTSDHEGLPNVIIEAMVLSRPIVATRIVGTSELLADGKYGVLVEPTEEGVYAGLKTLLSQPELRVKFTKTLIEERGNFVFSNSIQEYENLLDSL